LDFFLKQAENIKIVSDPKWLDETFMIRKMRKVNHDSTIQIDKVLYETQSHLKGMNVEIRYEPAWLLAGDKPVLVYIDGKKVGDARRVDFASNVYVRRNSSTRRSKDPENEDSHIKEEGSLTEGYSHSISFSEIMKGSEE